MILINTVAPVAEIGGKAYHLLSMGIKNTPALYVCPSSYFIGANRDDVRLAAEIDRLFSDKKLYAVRSSAVDEDSTADSFAGVHESYLNVKKADILRRINDVHASAFTPKALAYRAARGLSAADIRIAVVIQEMVQAEYAGVINTINPVTDNPDETVISVVRGLGDKIVDGSADGSTYVIDSRGVRVQGEDILSRRALKRILALAVTVLNEE